MRALAEYIMRGRMQATLVVVVAAAVPLLFWLSAAAGSLVLLRRGVRDAATVLVWALLPALAWWFYGEPRTALVVLGSLGLALLLRTTGNWNQVLLLSVALGVLCAQVLLSVLQEPLALLAEELHRLMPQTLGGMYQQLPAEELARLQALIIPVLAGLMGALLQLVSLLCLMLGRYWQAVLYNPGGFAREFRALRLGWPLAMGLLAAMLMAPGVSLELAMLTPLCTVPLAIAGAALLHGLVASGRLARFWLVGLYVSLLLFTQLVYPLLVVLAIIDSLMDFRGRFARTSGAGPANGEG